VLKYRQTRQIKHTKFMNWTICV